MEAQVGFFMPSAIRSDHDIIPFFRVNNFSRDVSDGENYTILLNQLKPEQCSRAPLQTSDLRTRAEQVCVYIFLYFLFCLHQLVGSSKR